MNCTIYNTCVHRELPEPVHQIWADGTIVIVFRKKSSIQEGMTGKQTGEQTGELKIWQRVINAPVFIAIYDSRIEITSPGGLPRGQTAARALAGYSKIRNDVLAKALNYMRFIEEWGSGLRRVNKVFADYGLQGISLEDAGFAVKMNVYRANAATKGADGDTLNVTLNSEGRAIKSKINTVSVTANDTVNDTVKSDGVTVNDRLIESVRKNPGKNADFHALQLGRTRRTVMRYLSKLSGQVEFRGAPKTGGYYCKD